MSDTLTCTLPRIHFLVTLTRIHFLEHLPEHFLATLTRIHLLGHFLATLPRPRPGIHRHCGGLIEARRMLPAWGSLLRRGMV